MGTFNAISVLEGFTPEFLEKKSPLKIISKFWEEDHQRAFKIFYTSMRLLDNHVDNLKKQNKGIVSQGELSKLTKNYFNKWRSDLKKGNGDNKLQKELLDAINEFNIPISPWEKLVTAMIYDIDHNGFETYDDFLDYTEGAAVAPGAVAMFLCGMKYSKDGYIPPSYNIFDYARHLARFSYVVHIMRDFQQDQLGGLNYFATDLLEMYNLDLEDLRRSAKVGVPNLSLIDLMKYYCQLAESYYFQSRFMLDQLVGVIDDRYLLSLEILFDLYKQIFDKIKPCNSNFTKEEFNISPEDKFLQIKKTITSFQM